MKTLLFFILIIFVVHHNVSSQDFVYNDNEIKEEIRKGLDKSYNFQFNEAEVIYDAVRQKYPHNPAYYFLMALNSYWKMFYFNNYNEKSKEYLGFLDNALALNEKLEKKHGVKAEIIFYYLAIHSSYALYSVQNKDNLKAIGSAKKTYDYIRLGYPLKEKYAELYFSAGIYDFYREQYPETHPFYKSFLWMFAPGDKEKGIKELQLASQHAIFTQTEAYYYLCLIHLKYLQQPHTALRYIQHLSEKYPNNTNFLMKYTEALVLSEKYEEGEKQAIRLNKNNQKIFQMSSYVLLGIIYEKHKKKYAEARSYYQYALKLSKEVNFPVNEYTGFAFAGLARIEINQNNPTKAKDYYKKAKEVSDYPAILQEAESYLNE